MLFLGIGFILNTFAARKYGRLIASFIENMCEGQAQSLYKIYVLSKGFEVNAHRLVRVSICRLCLCPSINSRYLEDFYSVLVRIDLQEIIVPILTLQDGYQFSDTTLPTQKIRHGYQFIVAMKQRQRKLLVVVNSSN